MISNVSFLVATALMIFSNVDLGCGKAALPSYIKICSKNDPNLEKCLLNVLESLRPRFTKGIPEMKLPPLEPFTLPEIRVDQGTGSTNFTAIFKNIVAYGAKDLVVKQLKIDFDNLSVFAEIFFPKLVTSADYNINGRVLVVPINGVGKSNGTFTDVTAQVFLTGQLEPRNNKTYLSIKSKKISIKIGDLSLHFSNLFNGNKELGDQTNKFINENWREIAPEINPLVEDTVGEIMQQMAKGVLETYAIEDVFPEYLPTKSKA